MAVITVVPVPQENAQACQDFERAGECRADSPWQQETLGLAWIFCWLLGTKASLTPTFGSPPVSHVLICFKPKDVAAELVTSGSQSKPRCSIVHIQALCLRWSSEMQHNNSSSKNGLELCLELWKCVLGVGLVPAVALLLVAFLFPLPALWGSKLEAGGEDKWRLKLILNTSRLISLTDLLLDFCRRSVCQYLAKFSSKGAREC